jgi:hypothetical protein
MLRELKLATLMLFGILLAIGIAVGIFVLPTLHRGNTLEREFLSHAINKQMLDRYNRIDADRNPMDNRFDVTDLFPKNMERPDFEDDLQAIGYVCKGDSVDKKSSFSLCSAEAGYTFACGESMLLTAEFDDQDTVTKIVAWYMLTCL